MNQQHTAISDRSLALGKRRASQRIAAVLIPVLSISLMLSIVLNIITYRRADQYYRERNSVQLDPLSLYSYPTQASGIPAKAEQTRVVFFGDSRALAWPDPQMGNVEFHNRGIGSQTTAQVRARFVNHIEPLAPDIVVVQVGVNDLKNVALFPQRRAEIVATAQQNIAAIVAASLDIRATVILTTIFPHGDVPPERTLYWSNDVATAIEEVNAFLPTLASDSVLLFETAPILADANGRVRKEYQVDLLHINRAGYHALNQELARILTAVN